ncbi:MAG: hypothetical protein JWP27_3073 [Flaviaesturariibacter sp.]|nr:hypothetical protein [Flaviaesturariibacter sp.]
MRVLGSPEEEECRRHRMTARRLGLEDELDERVSRALWTGGRARPTLTELLEQLDAQHDPADDA